MPARLVCLDTVSHQTVVSHAQQALSQLETLMFVPTVQLSKLQSMAHRVLPVRLELSPIQVILHVLLVPTIASHAHL